MRAFDWRLAPAAVAAWAITWVAVAHTARWAAVAAATAAVAGLAGSLALRRSRHATAESVAACLVIAAAAAALVLASASAQLAARERGPFGAWVADRAVARVVGRVTSDAEPVLGGRPGRPRWQVRISLVSASARGTSAPAAGRLVALGGQRLTVATPGARVALVGRLEPTAAGDASRALLSVVSPPEVLSPPARVWRVAATARSGLRRAAAGLPRDAAGLLPALAVGDTSALPADLVAQMRLAGLTHLTAVSGANLAVATAAAAGLAAALGLPRRLRAAVAGSAIAGFVVLARPEPSVLRAAVMGGVGLAGLLAGRRARALPTLCTAAVALLAVDPWLARAPGFALSVLATGALVVLAPLWAARLERRMPRPVALAIAAPAAAQAACGPVVVLLQPAVSLVAVPANLLAAPVVAVATLSGLIAGALAPVSIGLAHAAAWPGAVATEWIAAVARWSASVPGGSLPWPSGPPGACLLAAVTSVGVAGSLIRRPVRSRSAPLAAGLAAAMTAGWLTLPHLPPALGGRSWPPTGWAIAMCDVGQGDATVLRSGPDRALLIDAGPDPGAVDSCLRRLGVDGLDLVLLTHFHADHVLGLPGALDGRDVRAMVVSPLAEPAANAALVRGWARSVGVTPAVGRAGQAGSAGSKGWNVDWRVLAPTDGGFAAAAGGAEEEGTTVNESSVVIVADVSGPGEAVRILALGDLEIAGQTDLARRLRTEEVVLGGPVDVVKVAHHGSARQIADLYETTGARAGLIGVGAGNDYGHPAASALRMLDRLGMTVARTDLDGDIAVVPRPDGLALSSP